MHIKTRISQEKKQQKQPVMLIQPQLTLFKACTGIFGASMSLRSLSASNFRSLDILNLKVRTGKSINSASFCTNQPVHAQYILAKNWIQNGYINKLVQLNETVV